MTNTMKTITAVIAALTLTFGRFTAINVDANVYTAYADTTGVISGESVPLSVERVEESYNGSTVVTISPGTEVFDGYHIKVTTENDNKIFNIPIEKMHKTFSDSVAKRNTEQIMGYDTSSVILRVPYEKVKSVSICGYTVKRKYLCSRDAFQTKLEEDGETYALFECSDKIDGAKCKVTYRDGTEKNYILPVIRMREEVTVPVYKTVTNTYLAGSVEDGNLHTVTDISQIEVGISRSCDEYYAVVINAGTDEIESVSIKPFIFIKTYGKSFEHVWTRNS